MKHLAIKVINKYEAEAVQKALFDMGFVWMLGEENKINDLGNIQTLFPLYYKRIELMSSRSGCNPHCKLDCVEVSSSEFFATYAGHIERFPDYVKEEVKPRFKVGDKLWYVDVLSIEACEITRVDSTYLRGMTLNRSVQNVSFSTVEYLLDKEDSEWFSTPELAAKRFLELNK